MEKVTLEALTLHGLKTRTNNKAEMTPDGKIGPLWQEFYGALGAKGITPSTGFGVYTNFESDHTCDFDLIVSLEESAGLEGEVLVDVPAGTYLKFSATGPCPESCINLWGEIWAYFESEEAPKRTYVADFEKYLSMTEVEIYIGIEE